MTDVLVNYDTKEAVRWDGKAYVKTDVMFNDAGDAAVWDGSTYVIKARPATEEEFGVVDAFVAGAKSSTLGMLATGKLPPLTPKEMTYAETVSSALGNLAGDFPVMVAGAVAGGAVGGAATGGVGLVPAAGAGALALPRALRESIVRQYQRGATSAGSAILGVVSDIPAVALAGARGASEGALASVTGGIATKAVAEATASKAASIVAENLAQATAIGAFSAAVDQELPTAKDFIVDVVTGAGLQGTAFAVGKMRGLRRAFVEEGVDPRVVKQEASDAFVAAETDAANRTAPSELSTVEAPQRLSAIGVTMRDWVDSLYPIKEFTKDGVVPSVDPYLARTLKGSQTSYKTKFALEQGEYYDVDGKLAEKVSTPLASLVDERLFSVEEQAQIDTALILARQIEVAAKRPDKSVEGFDPKDAQRQLSEMPPKILDAVNAVHENARAMLSTMKKSGLIDADEFERIADLNEMYAPFKEARDETTDLFRRGLVGKGLQRFDGDASKIESPLASIVDRVGKLQHKIHTNAANIALVDNIEGAKKVRVAQPKVFTNEDGEITGVDRAPAPSLNEIDVFRDGKRERWKLPTDIMRVIDSGFETSDLDIVRRVARSATKVSKLGIITSLEFAARLVGYDQATAFFTVGGYVPFVDYVRGMTNATQKTSRWKQAALDGVFDTMYTDLLAKDVALYDTKGKYVGARDAGSTRDRWNTMRSVEQAVDFIGKPLYRAMQLSTEATRLRSYELLSERYRKQYPSWTDADVKARAAADARKATLDTTRMGAQMFGFNAVNKFMNAAVQAPFQAVEMLRKAPKEQVAMAAGTMVAGTAALWAANALSDEPLVVSDQDRANNWLFRVGDTILRIPKPPIYGALATATERTLDALFADGQIDPEKIIKGIVGDTMSSAVTLAVPDILLPAAEVAMGRSFYFNSPIVPRYMEDLHGEFQYTPNTTVMAKGLSRVLPGGVSPMNIDHMLRGYLGAPFINTVDALIKMAGGDEAISKERAFWQLPVVRAFARRYPETRVNAAYDVISEFEDDYQAAVTEARKSVRLAGTIGSIFGEDIIPEGLAEPSKEVLAFYSDDAVQSAMGRLNGFSKIVRNITAATRAVQFAPADAMYDMNRFEKDFGYKPDVGDPVQIKREEFSDRLLLTIDRVYDDAQDALNTLRAKKKEML